jgi:ABC-type antimicrobial peptide transport system permease subunit
MGPEGRVGGILTSGPINFHIVGIVGDLVYNDMYAPPAPMIFSCFPGAATQLTIRLKKGVGVQEALAKVKAVITKANPGYPFEYQFLDEAFGKLFTTEMLAGKLAAVFAALAIFISCLGLFSLAAHMAERRTKEIGIRKVLGATVAKLALVLSADFLLLVAVACLVAFPVAWWAMSAWLKGYAYRTAIHWWVFGAAGGGALFIAMLTLGWQTLKAASANPIKSLRAE